MLWAIALLGVAHLLANGEAAGVVLFGGLAVFGFAWQPLTDRRDAMLDPARWEETAAPQVSGHSPGGTPAAIR